MFTQCSKCETVFRLSADALRAAGGQVRCGRCGEVFNALSRLAEDATSFTKGESSLFLETRADEILESSSSDLSADLSADPSAAPVDIKVPEGGKATAHADELEPPPGIDVVRLQFIGPVDDELAAETSLEFTLPPDELDRIFVETRPSPLKQLTADGVPPHAEASTVDAKTLAAHPESSAATVLAPPAARPVLMSPVSPVSPVKAPEAPTPLLQAPPSRVTGLEVSEDVRQEMLSSLQADGVRDPARLQSLGLASRASLPFAAWLAAAIVLGILLLIQIVRTHSDWMAAHVPLLGGSVSAAGLSVYQLRQWGVTGDPDAKGTLRVRASIMNTSPQLQSYPLLRVTLVNRFGTHVGAREFEPTEYLGHDIARMLAPGERVDATLDILDPGKDAEGFEIDVCIRSADKRIFCAADAAQAK